MTCLLRFFKKGDVHYLQQYKDCNTVPALDSYVYIANVKYCVLAVSFSYGASDDTQVMVDVDIEEVEEEYDD